MSRQAFAFVDRGDHLESVEAIPEPSEAVVFWTSAWLHEISVHRCTVILNSSHIGDVG
jgi:hypothetical protein